MDDLPPLVSPDHDHGYPAGFGDNLNQRRGTPWPTTPSGQNLWHTNAMTNAESDVGSWMSPQAQTHHGWPVQTPQMQMAPIQQFPPALPMAGMPVWPQGFGVPAVMTTPMFIPTNPIREAGPGEDWVHVDREPQTDMQKWGGMMQRPRSRSASQRAPSPFSAESSPSSRSSHSIGRSRSYVQRVSEDDKRPPREWRLDFSMTKPGPIGAALGQLLSPKPKRARSPSIGNMNTYKTVLHPWLRYSSIPIMTLDLRRNTDGLRIRELDRPVNRWDLTRFTCEPPVPTMRLFNDDYPWYIQVESSNPSGVNMHDLFHAIWVSMQTPITHEDYWNSEMDDHVRNRIADAYTRRCNGDEEEGRNGVRRVDFLMDRLLFEGLVKTREGLWEMKIKRLP